ncbi:MAG: hypothetical protein ING71_02820 [Rhodocyclaceae bacterium]|nr:hypothetical protein [Rhodocyclaceae bacterium]
MIHTVILLLPEIKQAYPLSTLAFTQAQGSKKKIATSYKQALIVDRNGRFRSFKEIEVLGPLGNSFGRRILTVLQAHGRFAFSFQRTWTIHWKKQRDCLSTAWTHP